MAPNDRRLRFGVRVGEAAGNDRLVGLVLFLSLAHVTCLRRTLLGRLHCQMDAAVGSDRLGSLLDHARVERKVVRQTSIDRRLGTVAGRSSGRLDLGLGRDLVLLAVQT